MMAHFLLVRFPAIRALFRLRGVLGLQSPQFLLRQTEIRIDLSFPPLMVALGVLLLNKDKFFDLSSVWTILLNLCSISLILEKVQRAYKIISSASTPFLQFGLLAS